MANIKSAKKRAKQAEVHRAHNMGLRTAMRTTIKKVIKAIQSGDKSQAQEAYHTAVPFIDRMVNKGFIHKNKAARHKSRLNARIKQI